MSVSRTLVLAFEATAQCALARGFAFGATVAADASLESAARLGWRFAPGRLTLARAQRELGELSAAKETYQKLLTDAELAEAVVVHDTAGSDLSLTAQELSSAREELLDVLQLLEKVTSKSSLGTEEQKALLREGEIIISLEENDSPESVIINTKQEEVDEQPIEQVDLDEDDFESKLTDAELFDQLD